VFDFVSSVQEISWEECLQIIIIIIIIIIKHIYRAHFRGMPQIDLFCVE